MRLYHYVGPARIAERVARSPMGVPVRGAANVTAWVRDTSQQPAGGLVVATFVVDANGVLRIADRRSEHVACAGRGPVQSAGEITFDLGRGVEVVAASNQSTGYCPEPESWSAFVAALGSARLASPARFDPLCVFRRCVECGNLTLVKDGVFECGSCRAELPAGYNVQNSDESPSPAAPPN